MRKLVTILSLLFAGIKGYSQYSFSSSTTGTIAISSVLNISVTSGSSSTISTTSQYQNGLNVLNYSTIAIKSNLSWLITLKSNAANFTALSGGGTAVPCSIVGFRVNGASGFTTLSTTAQTLATGNPGNTSTSGNTFNIDLNYNPGFNYPGGIYSLGILYTITGS